MENEMNVKEIQYTINKIKIRQFQVKFEPTFLKIPPFKNQ